MKKPLRRRGAGKRTLVRRHYPIDAAWQHGIRAILAERELSQADLARLIKKSPAAVTGMLQSGTTVSTLVADVHAVLGLVPPPPTTTIARLPQQPDSAAA